MKEKVYETHPFLSDDGFLELESAVVAALRKGDEGYVALRRRKKELEANFPFVESVLEGAGPVSLSTDEHTGLSEYMAVSFEMERIERRSLYLAGHRDCLAYLRCLGVL
jgi:hypothetical protein